MAIVKIHAIRARLDKKVAYVVNEEKTRLDGAITYATNPEKTEQFFFTSPLNCASASTALEEMDATKRKWGKSDGVLGYHFIQSFAPGEVTPEQAHTIGIEFARRCFGDRFEVVIGTHLDKEHLHNHLIVNSVSFADGKKYHSSPESYYKIIRAVSDELCRENELSIITPHGKGKHYAEWNAEQEGKPTIRGQIRADVDAIIRDAYTYKSFFDLLHRSGYAIRAGPNIKYTAVRPPGGERFIRLRSLGPEYTDEAIRARLIAQRDAPPPLRKSPPLTGPTRRYRYHGSFKAARKIRGITALYFRYLYLLRAVKKRKAPRRVSGYLRDEVIQLDRYVAQHHFLMENKIDTTADLALYREAVEVQIEALTVARQGLYIERRESGDEAEKAERTAAIQQRTTELRGLRKRRGMCDSIAKNVAPMQERLRQTQAPQSELRRKEHEPNEPRKRGR